MRKFKGGEREKQIWTLCRSISVTDVFPACYLANIRPPLHLTATLTAITLRSGGARLSNAMRLRTKDIASIEWPIGSCRKDIRKLANYVLDEIRPLSREPLRGAR
jgi:hypothetical protein